MNKIKFFTAVFAASASFILAAAPKFSITITPVKNVYKTGEKVEFDLEVTHPGDYQLSAWQPIISKVGSPAGFEKKWNKWGSINLNPVRWVHQPSMQKNKIRTGFVPGKDFIPGDYNFGIVARLYKDGKYNTPPKLLSGRFNITIEAPDTPAKAGAFVCSFKRSTLKVAKTADGQQNCVFNAVLTSASENGACFRVKTFLTDAAGKVSGESEEVIGIRGKSDLPLTYSKPVAGAGEYRFNIEFMSNSSKPEVLKNFTFPVSVK